MSLAFKRRWGWDRKQRRPAKIFGWCGVVRFGPWRPGLAAGLGAEWGFTQNWTAKLEYLYITSMGTGVSTDHLNNIRAGINYRF